MRDFYQANAQIKCIKTIMSALDELACFVEQDFYAQYGDDYAARVPELEAPFELKVREPHIPAVTIPKEYENL